MKNSEKVQQILEMLKKNGLIVADAQGRYKITEEGKIYTKKQIEKN